MKMTTEAKVGIFFTIGVLIFIFFTFMIKDIRFFKPGKHYKTYFNQVYGLDKGDPVLLGGVEVGEVKELKFVAEDVEIGFWVEQDAMVKEDSVATLQNLNFLSGKVLVLSLGSAQSQPRPEGTVVPSTEATDINSLISKAGEVADDAKGFVLSFDENQDRVFKKIYDILQENEANINTILDSLGEASPKIKEAMNHINSIAKKIDAGQGTVGLLVKEDKLYKTFVEFSENLNEGASKINQIFSDNEDNLDTTITTLTRIVTDNEENLKITLTNLKDASPELKSAMINVNSIAKKMDEGEGTFGKLINESDLYDDTGKLVKEMDKTVDELREQAPITTFATVLFGALR